MVKLVIDMMGGDNGSKATIEAVNNFVNNFSDVEIIAVGNINELTSLNHPRIKVISSESVAPMECSVMQACRMKDSSIYKAVNAVKDENADGILSAGSTSAFLALTTLIIKKIDGVERPALITPFPTKKEGKYTVLLDIGASSENSPNDLVNFANMGEAYYKVVYKKENPSIHLICNGTEEGKGNTLSKQTYELLKDNKNFKGYIEGRDVLSGECDVVVFDGFTGNIFLKTAEGVAKMMGSFMKDMFKLSFKTKIGYLFTKKGVKALKDKMDYKKVGGALLVGVNTVAVKAHGNSDSDSFYCSMKIAYQLAKNEVVRKIKENI